MIFTLLIIYETKIIVFQKKTNLISSYPAMLNTANKILENERCKEVDENCMSIKEILNLIPDK